MRRPLVGNERVMDAAPTRDTTDDEDRSIFDPDLAAEPWFGLQAGVH